jgi:NDP-sugar pyrophosphorylase family protein
MNVILPMAGRGSRFSEFGFSTPKPFIEIDGKPMFTWALLSLRGINVSKLIIVALNEHIIKYDLDSLLKKNCDFPFEIVGIDNITKGQLSTVLCAVPLLEKDKDVLIISSDTLVVSDISSFISENSGTCSGIISVQESLSGDNWSFVKVNEDGQVIEVAEKKRISNLASTGIYYFSKCEEFIYFSNIIISQNIMVNGEFYIIPVYEQMINNNLKVKVSISKEMWDMGNPNAKIEFEKALESKQINWRDENFRK